jgi:hypothetical protein
MRLALIVLLLVAHCDAATQVWAVGDGVRVNPVTGQLFEGRADIHKDYPNADPRKDKSISLRGARNEFVAFQVIVETDSPLRDVDARLSALKGPGGATIDRPQIALFKEWYVNVRNPTSGYEKSSLGPGWYPDALMPERRGSRLYPGFPFSIPDVYNNIPAQRNQALWVDVFVPYDRNAAPPGRYSGEVRVSWSGGSDAVQVALEVWDFALPQETHLPGDIWNGSMRNMPPKDELAYYQLARQHRFTPLIYAYRPQLAVKGSTVTLDWADFDRRLSAYLDGSAFTAAHGYWGPGYGLPLDHIMLPFNNEKHGNKSTAWPIAMPEQGRTAEYEAVWKDTGRQIREHLDRDPRWAKVMKVAFLDGLDESYNEAAYEKMLYYGKLLHEAMGRGWFKYRVDGGYSRPVMERLSKEVELWVCHTVDFNIDDVKYFRTKGVDTWFYGPMIYEQKANSGCGSNTFLDLDLLVNRGIGWVGWKYQAGWVEWEFDWNAFASWYEAENFKEPNGRRYNGSGQLIYRGAVMNYNAPVPSIRLKAMRRGLQDYEYFWLLANAAGDRSGADELVDGVIYKRPFGAAAMRDIEIWKNDPDAWERARIAAGDRLDRHARTTGRQ